MKRLNQIALVIILLLSLSTVCFGSVAPYYSAAASIADGLYYPIQSYSAGSAGVRQTLISTAGTVKSIAVWIATDPGNGNSWTITVYKNGSTSGMSCTITGTAGGNSKSASSIVNTFAVAAGDFLTYRVSKTGTPAASGAPFFELTIDSTNPGESNLFGTYIVNEPAGTYYGSLNGVTNETATTTEISAQMIVPLSGTLKNLYISLATAPGGSETRVYTIRHQVRSTGSVSDTAITQTITGAATTGNDIVHTEHINAGDLISVKIVTSASAASSAITYIGLTLVADTPGEFIAFALVPFARAMNTGAEYYCWASSCGSYWASTPAGGLIQNIFTPYTAKSIYAQLSGTPGAGKSYTIKLYSQGADTALSTGAISDSAIYGDGATNILINLNDQVCFSATPSGTPTVRYAQVSLKGYISPGKGRMFLLF